MIAAWKMTERVNIEQRSTSQDSAGQPVESWSLVAAVWADVKKLSGISAIKADADVSIVKSSIRIRYMAGINAGMRVIHGSDNYDISAVIENRAERFIDLVCVKNG